MKLISLTLNGEYKGLANQSFNFGQTQSNILALIGLNGSGKSQLLELIAEIFAFLERAQRSDFRVRTPLRFGFELVYQIKVDVGSNFSRTNFSSWSFETTEILTYRIVLDIDSKKPKCYRVFDGEYDVLDIEQIQLPYVVGYASGLNENLQRSFMKNTVQYFSNMRTRLNRKKELEKAEDDYSISSINRKFLTRYRHLFKPGDALRAQMNESGYSGDYTPEVLQDFFILDVEESPSRVSNSIYIDYDCVGLALACLSILPKNQFDDLFEEISYRYPQKMVLKYDFTGGIAGIDEVNEIKMLTRIAGSNGVEGLGKRTEDEQYELYELDYMSGLITIDFSDDNVCSELREASSNNPLSLFLRLYKLQQLGVKNWRGETRRLLGKDNFIGTVKKPLKTKLPLAIQELSLSDEQGKKVALDDLSDGEAQFIQVLATAKVFSNEQALFLFDEPETHLNPSWRTYFHHYLSKALDTQEYNSQVFVSTHSPFMISSLKKEDVLFFERDEHGKILMEPIGAQTYGSSFEVLIKKHFGLRSLISQTVVEAVKEHLPKDDHQASIQEAREWIENNLGDSMEKAYLLRKLQS
ncbi:AAA family ATPase [Vibrio alginolyticus]|uniref:AAA family ATPase n=1 Tax=Vibrio alginolyticus TaxID=663 RepID=UPI001BD60AAD|nr:AAA family ATPase [Vibrio alginolyticus]MBT0095962.1 AAA family ATPase [Vibrio alginolyticus]